MRAVEWHAAHVVRVNDAAPQPELIDPGDAVIRVVRSAICGTDLHPYRGEIVGFTPGTVTGHEFTGVVEEVGSQVRKVRVGDRVLASDLIACGQCWYCRRGWHYQCPDVGLFGYDTVVGKTAVAGGHAEYVRVPVADVVLSRIPHDVQDEQALLIGDILATGYAAADGGEVRPGDTVAVLGCGPVGLMAMACAQLMGAARVLAIDPMHSRRALAAAHGAEPLPVDQDLAERVRSLTHGRGADVVLEAVGTDAALISAMELVRPRGTICAVGAHAALAAPTPTGLAFGKELTVRFAVGDPITSREMLMSLVQQGRIDPTFVISHRLPLSEAIRGFDLFATGVATKVVLVP
ncbi:alcohol dehydrogenase family protein [Micromonospora sp. NPDC000089]|uniref:alcohol dehydrogenase family protein n=1 Tax=unclassified Micromonospora TaxID=2617518 RepID=UPI00367D317F